MLSAPCDDGVVAEHGSQCEHVTGDEEDEMRHTLRKAGAIVALAIAVGAGLADLAAGQGSAATGAARKPTNAAEFDQVFDSIKNWGRWGKDDQLGALNLITEAKKKQAIAL